MSTYVWYSKTSKESGELLANLLGENVSHGTLPPSGFSGVVVSWGAAVNDKFKWANRNIRAIINDPRKIKNIANRNVMFAKLAEAGIPVVTNETILAGAQYENICNALGVDPAVGFVACRKTGIKPRFVTNQGELAAALENKCVIATEKTFGSSSRCRAFVVGGNVVGALTRKSPENNAGFAEHAAAQAVAGTDDNIEEYVKVLQKAMDKGLILPGKNVWAPYGMNSGAKKNTAITVAETLDLEFCAVDMVTSPGDPLVLNVFTTPQLTGHTSIHAPIAAAINDWIQGNGLLPRQAIQNMVDASSDEELEALLDKFRELRDELEAEDEEQVAG